MPSIEVFHGTAALFTDFRIPASGLHFGTLDQAAHAATLKLARLPLHEFEAVSQGRRWGGRIIQARLTFHQPLVADDPQTETAWGSLIERARRDGHDAILYVNAYEGRIPALSYVVWDALQVEVLSPDLDPSSPAPNAERPSPCP